MTSVIDYLIGRSWGHRLVIGLTAVVYGWLVLTDPDAAAQSADLASWTLIRLFTLIVASLLLATALEQLLPENAVTAYLGRGGGARNTVLAGLLGGTLLGAPFATYPIIQSVRKSGGSYAAMIAMLVGYSVIGIGRIPFGLVIFSPEVVALRLALALLLTVVASVAIWAIIPEREDGIVSLVEE